MSILRREQPKTIYVPENLTLPDEALFREYQEDALYFIHLLYRERIFNKKHRDEYIPVKKAYLRRQINQDILDTLLRSLIANNIIESDRHYVQGKKSIGYRLAKRYRGEKHRRYTLTDKFLLRRLDKWHSDGACHKAETPTHVGLERNFLRLKVNWSLALDDVEAFYQDCTSRLRGQRSGYASKQRKKARYGYNAELHALDSWCNGNIWFHPDDHGRIHTPLTSLSSRLRQYVALDTGEPLYEVDIVNSQPLVFACLMVAFFINKKQSFTIPHPPFLSSLSLPSLYDATFSLYNQTKTLNEKSVVDLWELVDGICLPEDALEYIRLCEKGALYEALQQEGQERKAVKKGFFKSMFSRSAPEWLQKRFPTVAEVARFAKKDDYKHLSHLLQSTEGKIIIEGVAARLVAKNRFVATIHDSLVVRRRDVRRVLQYLEEEFVKWRLSPAVKVKRITANSTASPVV